MRVFIGYDSKENEAYRAAVKSLKMHSRIEMEPEPLVSSRLQAGGLLHRTVDTRGQMYDMPSNAPCSTEFAASRFLVPILCQTGWALFTDCDVIFMCDINEIMQHADPDKAVMVVRHSHAGDEKNKMAGVTQTRYPRKNWSSVMLFNCDHPANRRLTIHDVSNRPGRDLHGFYWLHDSEIGELPAEWNWLVNVTEKPEKPCIAHFTLGGPWIDGWTPQPHDEIWINGR